MSTESFTSPPTLDSDVLQQLIEEIALDAKRRRESDDAPPYAAIELLRKHRIGIVQLPQEAGGGGYSRREFFSLLIRLAEADPDATHILRLHFGFAADRWRNRHEEADLPWLEKVLEGNIFAGSSAELNTNAVGSYDFDTTLRKDGENFLLQGRKFYSTGSRYADYLRISAKGDQGDALTAIIPAHRDGITHVDDWDGFGQQHTGSGTTILDDVIVHPDELLPYVRPGSGNRPRQAQAQLYLHAIAAGILRALVTDAIDLIRGRKRNFSWSVAQEPRHDPILLQAIGSLSAAAFVVEAAVLSAADSQERAHRHLTEHGQTDDELEQEASLQAARAKVGVEDLALRAATSLFDVGGASATRQSVHLDRHWRNLRTLFSHNPTSYKAHAIGDLIVNGNELPRVGHF